MDVSQPSFEDGEFNRFTAFFSTTGDAVFMARVDNNLITAWNKGAERLLGYTAEEAIGMSIDVLIPSYEQGHIARLWLAILQGHEMEPLPTYRIHKSGEFIPVTLRIAPIRDSNGIAREMGGMLREREEFVEVFDVVMEELPWGMALISSHLVVLSVNAAFCHMFDIERSNYTDTESMALREICASKVLYPKMFGQVIVKRIEDQVMAVDLIDLKDGRQLRRTYKPIRGHGRLLAHLWLFEEISHVHHDI